jgi:hypothetical protein
MATTTTAITITTATGTTATERTPLRLHLPLLRGG